MKTILITGATTGIGRFTALHLARRGHTVYATGRNQKALDELAVEAKGLPLHVLRLDVTDGASITAARDEIVRREGGVDVIVNNAGFGSVAPLEEQSDADLRAMYETNVFGLMAVTRAFVPALATRGGRIVNVSSIGGRITMPFMGGYNSTKYAVESLSDALRVEMKARGISVSLVEPGPIRTEFTNTFLSQIGKYQRDDSPYAASFKRIDSIQRKFETMSAGPDVIARAIEHAAVARRPRIRYVAPFSSRLMLFFAENTPAFINDWVMRVTMGLPKRRVLAAAATPRELPAA